MAGEPSNLIAIGYIHTPFSSSEGTPIQPAFARDQLGYVEIDPALQEGLSGLAGFSHAWLLYGFHKQERTQLSVKPFLVDAEVGVFASRAPCRPNHIGMTLVEILKVSGRQIDVRGVDMLDGSPLYDIKPFFGALEVPETWRTGWLDEQAALRKPGVADRRFS